MKCVECLATVGSLYSQVRGTVSLEVCGKCNRIADKYVEYEYPLIFLNVVLCKPQVYRHLLFNRDFAWEYWVLVKIVLGLCALELIEETWKVPVCLECQMPSWWVGFFLLLLLKFAGFSLGIFAGAWVMAEKKVAFKQVLRGIVLSSVGQLRTILVVTWNLTDSHIYLITASIHLSTMISVKELYETNIYYALCCVLIGCLAKIIINSAISMALGIS